MHAKLMMVLLVGDSHTDQVLGLQRVTGRAVAAGYLTPDSASQWLDYLATQTFFASTTLFVIMATAG